MPLMKHISDARYNLEKDEQESFRRNFIRMLDTIKKEIIQWPSVGQKGYLSVLFKAYALESIDGLPYRIGVIW